MLYSPFDKSVYELNDVAAYIIKILQKSSTEEQIIKMVLASFETKEKTVKNDIQKFLAEYTKRGIILRSELPPLIKIRQ